MWKLEAPLSTVFRRRENDGEPVNDRRLRAAIAGGRITRITRGVYVDAPGWRRLKPQARHAQLVWEAAARTGSSLTFSHWAAAALHGIDILGPWPSDIDVTIGATTGGRSGGTFRRHACRHEEEVETEPWGRHRITTALQTAVDLTASMRFVEAVAVADQALWQRREGGALVSTKALVDAAHSRTGRGSARAARAADFAEPLSDSVRESHSRVLIHVMGFPPPELQARFTLSNGRSAFTDFFWREHRHIGEFDGVGKYRDPELLRGRTAEEVLLAEKDREDELRRQVSRFSRWRVPALDQPRLLFDILNAAGLPTTRPRPGR
ncbi:hypothetical protein BH10ACT5_BH10ACT5_20740 [soil metagenome]|uniref:hypothetical protein n=1 Tax=Microbacterium sp. TaxID=51671 RepID=UPI0025F05238|nr:hypothetical protein [Microbacterium sp.]